MDNELLYKLANYAGLIHGSVSAFVKGLKGVKDPIGRGNYITGHLDNEGFQRLLNSHPQGSAIRKSAMGYLNSPANAGLAATGVKAKAASSLTHGLEVAGLGILGKPSLDALRDSNSTDKEKRHAKYEVAGLGTLAAHPIYELGSKAIKSIAKHASDDTLIKLSYWFKEAGLATLPKDMMALATRDSHLASKAVSGMSQPAMSAAQRQAKVLANQQRAASFSNNLHPQTIPTVVGKLL